MSEGRSPITRRRFLQAAATGTVVAAGASGDATARTAEQPVVVEVTHYRFKGTTESPLYITPGTTVRFVWKTGGHNIIVEDQPATADWEGHEAIEGTGFTYEHTFTVKGAYHFLCGPHANYGMIGNIIVNETGKPPSQTRPVRFLLKVVSVRPVGTVVALTGVGSFLYAVVFVARRIFDKVG